jgi:hypothetical protein
VLEIANDGPRIVATNYWDTGQAAAGKIYLSCNAGAVRMLLPPALGHYVPEMKTARYAILSRGPWPALGRPEAVEILWEDESDSPFAQQFSPESFDLLPAEPPPGRGWVISVWGPKQGRPQQLLERPCRWRRVKKIPCLKAWGQE